MTMPYPAIVRTEQNFWYEYLNPEIKKGLHDYCYKSFVSITFYHRFIIFLRKVYFFLCGKKEWKVSRLAFFVLDYLRYNALKKEHLFLNPGNEKKSKILAKLIAENRLVNLRDYSTRTVANAFRIYLEFYLEGIFPIESTITMMNGGKEIRSKEKLTQLIFTLDDDKRRLLVQLIDFLREIDDFSHYNKMNLKKSLIVLRKSLFPVLGMIKPHDYRTCIVTLINMLYCNFDKVPLSFILKCYFEEKEK